MYRIVDNDRISARQTYRLFLFDLIGASTLLVPSFVAGKPGPVGVLSILLGAAAVLFYHAFLTRAMECMGDNCRKKWVRLMERIFYGTVSALTAGYVAHLFARLMCRMLICEVAFWQVLLLLLLPAGYSVLGSVESRARTYEILFWPVLLCLFGALFLALGDIQYPYYEISSLPTGKEVFSGAYLVFLTFGAVAYMPFFRSHILHKRQLCAGVKMAILTAIGILIALYLVLVGNFGGRALGNMDYPAVVLLENIQFTGGFVKRLDAFMVAIWFFTLYAILNLNLYWGREMLIAGLKEISCTPLQKMIKNKHFSLGATCFFLLNTFGTALLLENMEGFRRLMQIFLRYGVGPGLILIPLLCVAGCGATELESRSFPMLLAVDREFSDAALEERVGVACVMPVLRSEPDAATVAAAETSGMVWKSDFGGALMACGEEMEKTPDLRHLKVLLLSRSYWEDAQAMADLLDYLRQEPDIPRNTYVCVTENVEEVLALEASLPEDLGSYVEELLEKKAGNQELAWLTTGKMLDEQENRILKFPLPALLVNNSKLSVHTSP